MGPDNWYVFSSKDIKEDLKKFKDTDFATTDLSHSRAIIQIEGNMVYEVLKKGSPPPPDPAPVLFWRSYFSNCLHFVTKPNKTKPRF